MSDTNASQKADLSIPIEAFDRLQNQPHRLSCLYLVLARITQSKSKLKFNHKTIAPYLTVSSQQGRPGTTYSKRQFEHDLDRLARLGLITKTEQGLQLVVLNNDPNFVSKYEPKHEQNNSMQPPELKSNNHSCDQKPQQMCVPNIVSSAYNNSLTLNSLYTAEDQDLQKPIRDDFQPSQKLIEDSRAIPDCPDPSDGLELAKFIAHYQHRGTRSANWDAAYRCWLLRGTEYNRKHKLKEKAHVTTCNSNTHSGFATTGKASVRPQHRNPHQKSKTYRHGGFDEFMAGLGDDVRSPVLELLRPTSEHGVVQSTGGSDDA